MGARCAWTVCSNKAAGLSAVFVPLWLASTMSGGAAYNSKVPDLPLACSTGEGTLGERAHSPGGEGALQDRARIREMRGRLCRGMLQERAGSGGGGLLPEVVCFGRGGPLRPKACQPSSMRVHHATCFCTRDALRTRPLVMPGDRATRTGQTIKTCARAS